MPPGVAEHSQAAVAVFHAAKIQRSGFSIVESSFLWYREEKLANETDQVMPILMLADGHAVIARHDYGSGLVEGFLDHCKSCLGPKPCSPGRRSDPAHRLFLMGQFAVGH